MRAEQDLRFYTYARDDAEHALLHSPTRPAPWILAQTHLAVGDITNARKHIYRAIKLNDSLPQFHLTYIDTLIHAGEVESALHYWTLSAILLSNIRSFKSKVWFRLFYAQRTSRT